MRTLTMILLTLTAAQTWAHGEDKPGPHGGTITMPGPFHVELIAINKQTVHAYLLDMDWKNPTLKDSSIEIKRGPVAAACKTNGDHFICEFSSGVNLAALGELTVTATRDKQKGNVVRYALPLKRHLKD